MRWQLGRRSTNSEDRRGMADEAVFLDIQAMNGHTALVLQGDWVIDHSEEIGEELSALNRLPVGVIDASQVGRMDMWGSIRLKQLLEDHQADIRLNDKQKRIFDFMPEHLETVKPLPKENVFVEIFETIGLGSINGCKSAYGILSFIGEIAIQFCKNIAHPSSFRFHSIVRHIDETGFRALPIIGLLAVLISMVISYQAATQLQKFGANIFTIDLTVISLLREMGVLITAIMVAGRSGSAFAAEIGVMKMREEVDALKTIGMNPIEVLILPRLIAMMITLPILAFLADIIGLAGGALISIVLLHIPLDMYIDRVQMVAKPMMFFVGMVKAPVFGFVITIIGTYQGMNVTGSAESVGKLTTTAVVQSIFLVIMVDAIFSILFANMGI